MGYDGGVSTQTALKLLFELRAVLDRLGESESTLAETMAQDIERAVRLSNACIAQLTEESPGHGDAEEDEDE